MYKKILTFAFFIILIVSITSVVYGAEIDENSVYYNKIGIQNNTDSNNLFLESKSFAIYNNSSLNKIQMISTSNSIFKSGTNIYLKVYTDKTIKSVLGRISGKNTYKFTETKSGFWYYNLKTKNFKTGNYKVNIKAIDSRNKVFKSSTHLTANNIPPKIYSVYTNVSSIRGGDPFKVYASADNSTKKIVASIRGQNHGFKKLNDTHWSIDIKLSYKEINTIIILVNAYDSIGNVAKRETFIESKPNFAYWNGSLLSNNKNKVSYPNPTNTYEKSINLLSKYATVYEGFAGNHYTLGITHRMDYGKKTKYAVTIAYKDPFVVYHELAHVLHWSWSEYKCDWYAYNKTAYWMK
ncbi:MAG: hypothetical protein LBU74_07955 [Methanobacteriaceae archaeon]|jgi:hypothetical protein|nr:hypothetical protein [Candidatus Methanorudis spinitermitis]